MKEEEKTLFARNHKNPSAATAASLSFRVRGTINVFLEEVSMRGDVRSHSRRERDKRVNNIKSRGLQFCSLQLFAFTFIISPCLGPFSENVKELVEVAQLRPGLFMLTFMANALKSGDHVRGS